MLHLQDLKWHCRKGATSGEAVQIKSQTKASGWVDCAGFDRALLVYYRATAAGSIATRVRVRHMSANGGTTLFTSGTNLSATRMSAGGANTVATGLANIDTSGIVTSGATAFNIDLRPLKRYLTMVCSATAGQSAVQGVIVMLSRSDSVPPATTGFQTLTSIA